MTVDLEGFTYLRQDQKGVLLGIYETKPTHWMMDGSPWEYGIELLQEDIDRISDELEMGFRRYPCLREAGVKKWVNGAFTFSPVGSPLVGPVPGLRGYWVACGVMAGFLQGGGVGKTLGEWMIHASRRRMPGPWTSRAMARGPRTASTSGRRRASSTPGASS